MLALFLFGDSNILEMQFNCETLRPQLIGGIAMNYKEKSAKGKTKTKTKTKIERGPVTEGTCMHACDMSGTFHAALRHYE